MFSSKKAGSNLPGMQVAAVAVIGLAVIVLIGLAVVEGYGKVLRTPGSFTNISVTVVNETNVRMGSSGTYPYLKTLPSCWNQTNETEILTVNTNYTFSEGDNTGGYIYLLDISNKFDGTVINCNGTYLASSTASGIAATFITGMTIFATFIGVVVLALVGKLIIGLFRKGKD